MAIATKQFRIEMGEPTKTDLTKAGLSRLSLPSREGVYLLGRVKEQEGIAFEQTGETDKAQKKYLEALIIFDNDGLWGECLRVSQRIGNETMESEYENELRSHWKQKDHFRRPCAIVKKFYDGSAR